MPVKKAAATTVDETQPSAVPAPAEKLAAKRAKRARVGAATIDGPTVASESATEPVAAKPKRIAPKAAKAATRKPAGKAVAKKVATAKPASPKRATATSSIRGGARPLTIPKGYLTTRQLALSAKVSLPTAIKYAGKLKAHSTRASKLGVEDSRVKTLYKQSAVKALQGLRDEGYGRRGRYTRA